MTQLATVGKATKITVDVLKLVLRDVGGPEAEQRDPDCPGLVLRVRPRSGARWSYKGRLHGREKRWDLGQVVATRDSLADIRGQAARIREALRKNIDPMAATFEAPPIVKPPASWDWEAGVEAFLAQIQRTRRPDTLTDYRRILRNTKELNVFHGRPLAGIEREEIAGAIRIIHERGVESHAAHVLRVVRSFWTWLSEDGQRKRSLVEPNLLYRLRPPEKTRSEVGDRLVSRPSVASSGRKRAAPKLPTPEALGRTLAIAESGALDQYVSWAIGLLLYTAQRRRAIMGAFTEDFSWIDPDAPAGTVVWNLPPFYRKTGRTRGAAVPHRLPLTGSAAELVRILQNEEDVCRPRAEHRYWLFPARYPKNKVVKRKSPTLDPGVLNHNLLAFPKVEISPHGIRRAFFTYGKKHLGFTRDDAKLVLDHNEGRPSDATAAYDWDEEMNRKLGMLAKWGEWLDGLRDAAIAADPMLREENKEQLAERIRGNRYRKKGIVKDVLTGFGSRVVNYDEDDDAPDDCEF
ncbi:integrase family protein [Methylobacterium sp. C25]|uniref:tyrosine-type recombinase/integrase n=1 Tax=Methylobacterium sp. C25 TaxID=2721622 RepID=UPI001F165A3A|nr:integrase family protein [Methylobacterium sp. C25]MCE4226686.1 integrase family protein [Methylobacterium sp. C25]